MKRLNKMIKWLAVVAIVASSLLSNPIVNIKALATNVTGDQIIARAKVYESWSYYDVGTCTGLVTRVLDDLGIGDSIVGSMVGSVAKYSPDQMYANAIANPQDAQKIWEGKVRDFPLYSHLARNGDLVIQKSIDKVPYDGFGHVAFIRKNGSNVYMYGANNPTNGVSDALLTSNVRGIPVGKVDDENVIRIFRIVDDIQPAYATLSSSKEATEKVKVSISKKDIDTDKPLSDVKFDFYRDNIKFASDVTTNSQGIANAVSTVKFAATSKTYQYCTNFNELSEQKKQEVINAGIYTSELSARTVADNEAQQLADEKANQTHSFMAIETLTKTKYWLNSDNDTVSQGQKGSGNVEMEITNTRVNATIDLKKVDADTNSNTAQGDATLEGAIYGLYARENILDPADDSVIYPKGSLIKSVTIENGKATINNLFLGDYFWKEIKAPQGYTLDTKEHNVSLDYEGQNVLTVKRNSLVKDEVITGDFDIEKIITNGENSEIVEKEEGAEFVVVLKKYVEQYGSIEEAYENRSNFTDKEFDKLVTNKEGYDKSNPLAYGEYAVKQIKGKVDTDILKNEFTFKVEKENQKTIRYIINNRPFTSQVKLIKVDKVTGKRVTLNSAKFKIKDSKGNYVVQKVAGVKYDTFITNSKNNIVSSIGKYGEVILPLQLSAQKYTIEEIETPDGFLELDYTPTFTISNIYEYEEDEDKDPIVEIKIKNEQPKGSLIISKSDKESGNPLDNVEYVLKAKKDVINKIDGSVMFKAGETVSEGLTNASGELRIDHLFMGHYELKEILANEGYVLSNETHDVVFTQNDTITKKYEVAINITNIKPSGSISLVKSDKDSEELLGGVTYQLTAKEDIYSLDGRKTFLYAKDKLLDVNK